MVRDRRRLTALATVLVLACAACSESAEEKSKAPALPAAPQPIQVSADRSDLVFRYVDPATGEVATTVDVKTIPKATARQVVVFDQNNPTPPGWEHVVDLSSGELPVTSRPTRGFVLRTPVRVKPAKPAAAKADADAPAVVMFTTTTCPHCRRARKWLQAKKVRFVEHQLDKDPGKQRLLQEMGREAGLGPGDMEGVPLIFVGKKVVRGFDKQRLKKLLGV